MHTIMKMLTSKVFGTQKEPKSCTNLLDRGVTTTPTNYLFRDSFSPRFSIFFVIQKLYGKRNMIISNKVFKKKIDLRLMVSSSFVVNVCDSCLGTFSLLRFLEHRVLLTFLCSILV